MRIGRHISGGFIEVTVVTDNATIESGILDKEEALELSSEFYLAALKLLEFAREQ